MSASLRMVPDDGSTADRPSYPSIRFRHGPLTSRFGLASDCVKQARVVLADGAVVTASATDNPDLFWALRGGGSGFGVVTSLTMALHALPQVWTAMILVPLDKGKASFLRAQDLIDQYPDELGLTVGFRAAPKGQAMLLLAPLWTGDPDVCATLLQRLTSEGAQVLKEGWSTYRNTLSPEFDKAWPKGRNYHLLTRTLRRLNDEAADMLLEAAAHLPSPYSGIGLHDFHGAPTRIAPDATAFPLREPHFVVQMIAAWDDEPDDGARHRRWAEDLSGRLSGIEIPGGYVNLLAPAESERVHLFYGPAESRLRAVKRRVDPDDLFRAGIGRLSP